MSARLLAGALTSGVALLLGAGPSSKAKPPAAHVVQTRCDACHSAQGWTVVRFNHAKTGFPLNGAHAQVSCKACHPADFMTPVLRDCAGCHGDVHAGELGLRCAGCHDEVRWQGAFRADAHRKTGFPLIGRHAMLPCEECHADAAGRRFALPAAPCITCHQRDYDRTALGAIDHARAGFGTDCQACHDGWRFFPGRFPAHDRCFEISVGKHAHIPCLSCHSTLPRLGGAGACQTQSAACSNCHEHACAKMDERHRTVPGYQCKDPKCYSCHRFAEVP
ncbi:MAG: cytochrome C [Myxococcota bacterium]